MTRLSGDMSAVSLPTSDLFYYCFDVKRAAERKFRGPFLFGILELNKAKEPCHWVEGRKAPAGTCPGANQKFLKIFYFWA